MVRHRSYLRLQLAVAVFILSLFGLCMYQSTLVEPFKSETQNRWRGFTKNSGNSDNIIHPNLSGDVEGNTTLFEQARPYIAAIFNPHDTTFDRLICPEPSKIRYEHLKNPSEGLARTSHQRKYLFALDLHQCASLLPRLMGSVVEAIQFLGPENCAISIVEGRSDDGTWEILSLLQTRLQSLGVAVYLQKNDIDPLGEGIYRIQALAELRNAALLPLQHFKDQFSREETTVVFINDVAICLEDILELIHQRRYQNANMVCAMDWTLLPDPTFYDVWIARTMAGDLFFNIPPDGGWDLAKDIFWNDPDAKLALENGRPFQVYSCWNGATAFTAKPIIDCEISFRIHYENECPQGEPKSLCKDLWARGYGKIAVVPSVKLEYNDERGKKVKNSKGYVGQWLLLSGSDEKIDWQTTPPAKVKCMPTHQNQFYEDWDAELASNGQSPSCISAASSLS